MKKSGVFVIISVLCGASVGCRSLSQAGKSVIITQSPARSCKVLRTVKQLRGFQRSDDQVQARNLAGKVGGSHATMRWISSDRVELKALKCPSVDQLQDLCDIEKKPLACYDHAYEVEADVEMEPPQILVAYDFYVKGCELKDALSCKASERLRPAVTRFQDNQKLESDCTKSRNGKACLEMMANLYQDGELEASIKFSQLACIYGEEKGCSFHKDLISQKTSTERNVATERAAAIQADAITNAEVMRQNREDERRAQKAIGEAFQSPKRTTTDCQKSGNGVSCTSTEY